MLRVIRGVLASGLSVLLAYGVPLINFVKRRDGKYSVRRNWPTQWCDLYVPEVARSNTLFIFIHGGGWHSGTKDNTHWVGHAFVGEAMASDGILTAVLTYPCVRIPAHAKAAVFVALAIFAVCLAFVLSLVLFSFKVWLCIAVVCWTALSIQIWLREFATSGTDDTTVTEQFCAVEKAIHQLRVQYPMHRMVLAGHSAGGHLAMLYATKAPGIDTVIGISGVYDIDSLSKMTGPLGFFVSEYCLKPVFREVVLDTVSPIKAVANTQATHVVLISAYCDQPVLEAQADAFYAGLVHHTPIEKSEAHRRRPDTQTKMRVTGVGLGHGFGLIWSEELWTFVRGLCCQM